MHVRAFYDSGDHGMGDFAGLTQKLDYLQELGVTAIWVLPFNPVAMARRRVRHLRLHWRPSSLWNVEGLPDFLERGAPPRAASHHGVGAESYLRSAPLVSAVAAVPARLGLAEFLRLERYPGQVSRCAHHLFKISKAPTGRGTRLPSLITGIASTRQPDLNYESQEVHAAVLKAMEFWLDMGVDGFRLDAVPYLYERDGTNCENPARDARFPEGVAEARGR